MIVLDTNVISALMRPHRSMEIQHWLNRQPAASLWTTTVSVYEILAGVRMLPDGKRRRMLEEALDIAIKRILDRRIIPFDLDAADHAAAILARRLSSGVNKGTRDTQIAGIVMSRKARFATRNVTDFDDLDIEIIDPWTAEAK